MRVNLAALPCEQSGFSSHALPITVQIRPSRGMVGEHSYTTDSRSLVGMLERHTDISGGILDGFKTQMKCSLPARLFSVELSDRTLRDIGFFLD